MAFTVSSRLVLVEVVRGAPVALGFVVPSARTVMRCAGSSL
ncbi:MAG: hypothetical protein ACLTMP_13080 [Eggerthella lenta]